MAVLPFVTVGIIVKNEGVHIARTLRSLAQLTYPRGCFGIVVVDGDSTDGTREQAAAVLAEVGIAHRIIAEKDCRGGGIESGPGVQHGHSFARNIVIDNLFPDSAYVAWTDGDCRVDAQWLELLVATLESAPASVAAAGGARLVETQDSGWWEVAMNTYLTSPIVTLGNPAFYAAPRAAPARRIRSVAGYNSLYRATVLREYRYDTTFAFFTDDIELNHRLSLAGRHFILAPEARVWHRADASPRKLLRQLYDYGSGAARVARIHRRIPRWTYVLLSLGYLGYLLALPIAALLTRVPWWQLTSPLMIVGALALATAFEGCRRSGGAHGLPALPILPLHPLAYGLGFLKGLFERRPESRFPVC